MSWLYCSSVQMGKKRMTLGFRFNREFIILPCLSHYSSYNSRHIPKVNLWKSFLVLTLMVYVHQKTLSHTCTHCTSKHTNKHKMPAPYIFLIPIILFSFIFHVLCSVLARECLPMLLKHIFSCTNPPAVFQLAQRKAVPVTQKTLFIVYCYHFAPSYLSDLLLYPSLAFFMFLKHLDISLCQGLCPEPSSMRYLQVFFFFL